MFDDAPPVGYASGLYTDLRSRLVFYAAFESAGGVVVAVLATEGPMRTVGGMLRLEDTQLSELPSIASVAANLVVDADARTAGRRKQGLSSDAAKALGFVRSFGGGDVLPASRRCSRWTEFSARAGRGLFAAWAGGVLAIAPDLPSDSPILAACDRILGRWPGAARLLASRVSGLAGSIVDVSDDELPAFVAGHVLAPADTAGWSLDLASGFLAGIDGFEPVLDLFEAVDLVGRLPAPLHPFGDEAWEGFDGAAALLAELRRRQLAPADLRQLFATFAADWTKCPSRNGFGEVRTAEEAADLIEAHVAVMARRFGVPAWLEFTLPDFRNMSARSADSLVLAVLLALREDDDAGSEFAEVFLGEVDLVFLLDALRTAKTAPAGRVEHVADVERNFRDAEAAGELRGRLPARLSIGGARRIGIELVEAGFGRNIDLDELRRGIEGPPDRPDVRPRGIPVLLHQSAAPVRVGRPRVGTLVMGLLAGVVLAGGLALLSEAVEVSPSILSKDLRDRQRAAEADQAQLAKLASRRADLAGKARLDPAPCPESAGVGLVCGKFGDLVLAVSENSWPKPAVSGYVVDGRYPVEVFAWSGSVARNPSPVWVRHLLGKLDAMVGKSSQSAAAQAGD